MRSADFESAAGATSHCLMLTDATLPGNPIVFVNPAFTILTGYAPEEAIGRNCRFLQGPDTDPVVVAQIRDAITRGVSIQCEILNYRKNGEPFWNNVLIDPIRDDSGMLTGFVGTQHDSSEKHAAVRDRIEAQERLAVIIGNIPGFVFQKRQMPDGALSYSYVSTSLWRILELPEDGEASPAQVDLYLHPDDRERELMRLRSSAANLTPLLSEFRLVSPQDREHWFRSDSTPHIAQNGDIIWDGLAVDISAEKAWESRLAYMAYHDSLTGLSNRLLVKTSLIKAIAAVVPEANQTALFYVDLVQFQTINDTLGQSFGDRVLREVGLRLGEFAESHGGMAARLGGDEFTVLLPDVPLAAPMLDLAEAIGAAVSRGFWIDNEEILIEACIGVTVFPYRGEDNSIPVPDISAEMMTRAHLALHAAKREGAGTCRLYSAEIDDRFRNRMVLRKSFRRAINEEQFTLHYQPVVDIASGHVVAAEALVRWNHPQLGLQRPDLFIPLAESSGLIVPLGAWVVRTAMRQAQAWRQKGIATPMISINVSSVQLQKPGFVVMVEQALADVGGTASDFEFELTESTLIEASNATMEQLEALKALGFSLAINDFGAGYSTFRYLRDFTVNKIKIDQSFIRQLAVNSNDASIVRAMITLARNLKLDLVAEGVETAMQRSFLRDEGCLLGQGYFFSLPLAGEDFEWLLTQQLILPVVNSGPPMIIEQ